MDKLLEITKNAAKKLNMARKLVSKFKRDWKRGSFLQALHKNNSYTLIYC